MTKNKSKLERHHMSKVAALGCIACRKIGYEDTPAELHHIRNGQGMSQRASNFEVIPLCPQHHRHGSNSIHLGKLAFVEEFGTERELLEEVNNAVGYKASVSQ